MKPLKLKTKIVHQFEVEDDLMEDLDFTVDIPKKKMKIKTKIVEVRKLKPKYDASTRLF